LGADGVVYHALEGLYTQNEMVSVSPKG
jgi:hypothetical protein